MLVENEKINIYIMDKTNFSVEYDTKTSHIVSDADFSEPRHTSIGVSTKKLLVLPNCNILDRTRSWPGPLLPKSGTLNRGCSVNALRFLGEISVQSADSLLEEIDVGKYSDVIPFSYIVDVFNNKIVNTEDFSLGDGSEISVEEARIPNLCSSSPIEIPLLGSFSTMKPVMFLSSPIRAKTINREQKPALEIHIFPPVME